MKPRHLAAWLVPLAITLTLAPAHAASPSPKAERLPEKAERLPEDTKYWVLFRHIHALEAKASSLDRAGDDGTPYRDVYRQAAQLDDLAARELTQIALDCVARVAAKDAEALAIIRAARRAVPQGKVAKESELPRPPAELEVLQKERGELILAAREELRRALGAARFQQLQRFVDEEVAPHITRELTRPPGTAPSVPGPPPLPAPPTSGNR